MIDFIRLVFIVVGAIGAYQLGSQTSFIPTVHDNLTALIIFIISGVAVGYLIGGIAGRRLVKLFGSFEHEIQKTSLQEILFAIGGLLTGLILAWLISIPFGYIGIPFLQFSVALFGFAALGFLGVRVALTKGRNIRLPMPWMHTTAIPEAAQDVLRRNMKLPLAWMQANSQSGASSASSASDKILDTSVIIDGRIVDIVRTGFLEGRLIVPSFVLRELQLVADSEDSLKRARGRRGLDVLKSLQEEAGVQLEIVQIDYPEVPDVDSKLVKMSGEHGGGILTNDYNLNKVANLQGISVLNLNDLAQALRPVVLPGEDIVVSLIREGKVDSQGVGYLDDGTMVVVDGGRSLLGKKIGAEVTSVLQTSAGRMIFGKVKG